MNIHIRKNPALSKKEQQEIQQKIKDNGGYCPCQIEKNDRTKCICRNFVESSEKECHCSLYIKI